MATSKLLAFLLSAAVLINCTPSHARSQARSQTQASVNPDLLVGERATSIKVEHDGNTVAFELNEPYPAERFRLALDSKYRPATWMRADELWIFPGRRTSENPGGWARYLEGDGMTYMWVANWVDVRGNVVTYAVKYKFPHKETPRGDTAIVDGIYLTAAEAKKMKGQ